MSGHAFCFSYNDNEEEGCRFEDRLSLYHLQVLEAWFKQHHPPPQVVRAGAHEPEHREPGLLNRTEFKQAIKQVLGTNEYASNLDTLFTKVGLVCLTISRHVHLSADVSHMCLFRYVLNRRFVVILLLFLLTPNTPCDGFVVVICFSWTYHAMATSTGTSSVTTC